MDPIHVRRVAPPERRMLHRMKRQRSNAVNSNHARVILLSTGGLGNRAIAERVGYTPQWVRRVIHRFNTHGVAGIEWYPYWQAAGPRKFFAEVTEQILEIALSSPTALIGLTQWSLRKLREYLIQQQVVGTVSVEWLRQLLVRCGVRWRRSKTWKESRDPEFSAKYDRIRRLYQRRPVGGRRICVDEFGPLNLVPRSGGCWAKPPQRRVDRHRATYHRYGGVRHFLAAYDLETGRLFGQFKAQKTWRDFLSFLRWLRGRYHRKETLHIVLDNYKPHLTEEVLQWASANRIKFYFTPTNASWLNRIECQFTALKKFALDNSDYQSHEEMQEAIKSYLLWRNNRRAIAIEPWRVNVPNQRNNSGYTAA